MKKVLELYKKYEEVINYLIMGVLTTVVSIATYAVFAKGFHVHYQVSNIISWIVSVTFAFITNKWLVFKSKSKEKNVVFKEACSFYFYRLLSLVIDMGLMYLFVSIMKMDDMISKVIVQFIVIVLNYVFSKLFVFKKEEK